MAAYDGITSRLIIVLKQGGLALMVLICSFACLWIIAVCCGWKETSLAFEFASGGLFLVFCFLSAFSCFEGFWLIAEAFSALFNWFASRLWAAFEFFGKIILETFGWKEFSPYLCTRFARRAVRRVFGSDERKEFFERIYIDRESSTGSVRRASVPSGRVEETNRSVFASLRSGGAVVLWTLNSWGWAFWNRDHSMRVLFSCIYC